MKFQDGIYLSYQGQMGLETTFAKIFLPSFADCSKFVNVDMIASGLSPFEPQSAAIEAGKLMLRQIEVLARQNVSFGFETTLSGKMHVRLIQDLQKKGYVVHIIYLWLPSVELAIQRVRDRVQQGGHLVPEKDIRRRFKRGLENLMTIYRFLADDWQAYDNRTDKPKMIAFGKSNDAAFEDQEFYDSVKHLVEKQ